MTAQCLGPNSFLSRATLRRSAVALLASSSLFVPSLPPATAAASRSQQAAPRDLIPNYGVIWEGRLTRSGQPRNPEGWEWLRRRGVKSVVDFRTEADDTGPGFEHVLWLPFTSHDLPTDGHAEEFLAFVRDPRNWPVHIHCKRGKDRTGVMAALVRYAIDGWSLERALAESRTYLRRGKDLAPRHVAWLRRWAAGHAPGADRDRPIPSGRDTVSLNHRRAGRFRGRPARSATP